VAVFDPVVHHLHVMAGTTRAHVRHARLSVFSPRSDGAQNRRDRLPCLARPSRHNRRAEKCALLAARYTYPEEMNAGSAERIAAAIGVTEKQVAAIEQHVAGFEMGTEMFDDAIDGRPCRHHDED